MKKIISNVAMSLDGYIAKNDGDISFLSAVEKEGEDYGYADFLKSVDTIIVGRKTYDKILSIKFEYPSDKDVYVITHDEKSDHDRIKFYTGSLLKLVSELRIKPGKNIFCDGGSEIINQLINNNLIDEFIVSVIPIILGSGIPLFKSGIPELTLKLVSCHEFDTGLVQLHYVKPDLQQVL
jgi:dihydrofolate reductase